MPYKYNKTRRHKIKKAKYKVKNWREYNEALRKRGNITFYFSEEAISSWNSEHVNGKLGRPQKYSQHAIECCLMIRQVFKLALRQTEGFMCSVVKMMGLNLSIPDYSCISKRSIDLKLERLINSIKAGSYCIVDSTGLKIYGKDQWHQEKHKVQANRSWRKLHVAIDEKHQIIASDLTTKSVGDRTALPGLFKQLEEFKTFIADGAYDGDDIYAQVLEKQPLANIVIPPPKNAVPNASKQPLRNQHVDTINKRGRIEWQRQTHYGLRYLVELAILRYKTIIGPKLKARQLPQQQTEVQYRCVY